VTVVEPPAPATGDETKPDDGKANDIKAMEAALRKANKEAADTRAKLKELEDRDKSDNARLTDQLAEAERRATAAEADVLRFQVATEKNVKARWLSGSTREELEAAADEYLADHPPATGTTTPTPKKPTEDLKGGGDPTNNDAEPNIDDIVKKVPRL
jgi:hypothetical protein